MSLRVANLKKQLEHLFPGKWLSGNERSPNLPTGLPEIDQGITRGIAKRKITEWTGAVSSGKTSLLRAAISKWCQSGLNVAYIDAEGRLLAADWAFVESVEEGKFWIVRPPDKDTISVVETEKVNSRQVVPLVSRRNLYAQEALWSADQFIRSNAFDVVVLDFGGLNPADQKKRGMSYTPDSSRIYARLQRSLDKSKAALIIVRDSTTGALADGWGCHARFQFDWGTSISCQVGLSGLAMITPTIKCNVMKDGMSQMVEVSLGCTVQNRLFTHPQVPDRRTSKG